MGFELGSVGAGWGRRGWTGAGVHQKPWFSVTGLASSPSGSLDSRCPPGAWVSENWLGAWTHAGPHNLVKTWVGWGLGFVGAYRGPPRAVGVVGYQDGPVPGSTVKSVSLSFSHRNSVPQCWAAQAWGKSDGVAWISFLPFSTCLFLFLCFTYNSAPRIFGFCEGIFVCRVVQFDVSGKREALELPIQLFCWCHSPRYFCSYFKYDKIRPLSRWLFCMKSNNSLEQVGVRTQICLSPILVYFPSQKTFFPERKKQWK